MSSYHETFVANARFMTLLIFINFSESELKQEFRQLTNLFVDEFVCYTFEWI